MKQSTHVPRVALVHDFLVSYGGAERVFEVLCEMYSEAPVYTLLYDADRMGDHFKGRDIRTSWLGKLPRFIQKRYRLFLPFFSSAVESFDLREFDLVISSSGAWSKGIITRLHTTHVAYLHSPMRYAWDYHEAYLKEISVSGRFGICARMLMSYLRIWDAQAADRPDVLLTNSQFTQARIEKYYRRAAHVIYPGALSLYEKSTGLVEVSETKKESSQIASQNASDRYFLVVSRLTRSKKIDTVIEAFNKLSLPLLVVGTGPEEKKLRKTAKGNTRFIGFTTDVDLIKLYQGARAVIFPSEEDFGMVAVEALSFGTPVIGLDYGGLREIITPGVTGELFHSSSPEIIAEGVHRFLEKEETYDVAVMKESVQKFSTENFKEQIKLVLGEKV